MLLPAFGLPTLSCNVVALLHYRSRTFTCALSVTHGCGQLPGCAIRQQGLQSCSCVVRAAALFSADFIDSSNSIHPKYIRDHYVLYHLCMWLASPRLHLGRAPGCYCHHWHLGRFVVACSAICPGSGQTHAVLKQPEADRAGTSQLPWDPQAFALC